MEVPVHVWRVGRDDESRYLLVLRDETGHPLLMTIGPCEAVAIWNGLQEDQRGGGIGSRARTISSAT